MDNPEFRAGMNLPVSNPSPQQSLVLKRNLKINLDAPRDLFRPTRQDTPYLVHF